MANLTGQSATALVLTLIATIVGIVSMTTDHWADARMFENAITGMGEKVRVYGHILNFLHFAKFASL